MTWKNILKQREYDLLVLDPNDSRPDAIVFTPDNGKFEANDDANVDFDVTEESYPETPLIPFFKKFGDSNKQFTEQEIESAAKSMGLKVRQEYNEDYEEDDPNEYRQFMMDGQYEQGR